VGGILLIVCEFIWVGKVWFGVAGAICALSGVAAFSRMPHTNLGIELLLGSVVCFAVEAGFETFWIAGVLGSLLWAIGFHQLQPSLLVPIVFPLSAIFGGVMTWLLSTAKRARRNKRLL